MMMGHGDNIFRAFEVSPEEILLCNVPYNNTTLLEYFMEISHTKM